MIHERKVALIKKVILCLLVVVSFGILMNGEVVNASSGSSFSVRPIIPDNQNSNLGYFNLDLNPMQKQVVQVEVFNESEEEIEVVVEVNKATTSDVGNINYQQTDKTDESLIHNIEEVVTSEKEKVILLPRESKIVHFTIKMPEVEFKGILLGGLRFTLADKENEVVGIENRFAYTVGFVLSNSQDELPVNLNLMDITTGQLNYRNHILVNLQNDIPRIIDQMEVCAKVYVKNENTLVYSSENSGLRMAPNSNFYYGISTNETAFKSGEYTLELVATADKKKFEWTQDFKISEDEADNFNKDAILIDEPVNNIWMWVSFIAGGICTVLSILYIKKVRTIKNDNKI